MSVEAGNEWPLHWVLTSINKRHVQRVNGVLTSPATVRDKDGKRGKRQGAVSAIDIIYVDAS